MPHDDNQLQQLLNQDPNRPWYRVENAAKAGEKTRAKVHIFDAIGGWFGVRAKDLVKEINALDVDELEVRLNSPGGQVWDGIAIMNALRAHRATVEVHVDGMAASIASVIAMGGDRIIMSRGAQMMIHCASTITWGNAAELRKDVAVLDKMDANIAGIYAARAGGEAADWLALMGAETWYNAAEAVDAGLADESEDSDIGADDVADATARFDLSIYNHAGRAQAPAPLNARDIAHARATYPAEGFSALLRMATASATHQPPATEPGTQQKEKQMSFDTLTAGLRERLGITDAETDENGILAVLDERLTAAAPTNTAPAGTTLIDTGVLATLQADAQSGREAREQQITERRDGIIAAAQREGRITAASAKEFRAMLDKDEAGAVALLATLPENSAVPVDEIGSSGGENAEDAEYRRYYNTTKEA